MGTGEEILSDEKQPLVALVQWRWKGSDRTRVYRGSLLKQWLGLTEPQFYHCFLEELPSNGSDPRIAVRFVKICAASSRELSAWNLVCSVSDPQKVACECPAFVYGRPSQWTRELGYRCKHHAFAWSLLLGTEEEQQEFLVQLRQLQFRSQLLKSLYQKAKEGKHSVPSDWVREQKGTLSVHRLVCSQCEEEIEVWFSFEKGLWFQNGLGAFCSRQTQPPSCPTLESPPYPFFSPDLPPEEFSFGAVEDEFTKEVENEIGSDSILYDPGGRPDSEGASSDCLSDSQA